MKRISALRCRWMGQGVSEIQTDVPFLNHMLDLFTKHGQFNLTGTRSLIAHGPHARAPPPGALHDRAGVLGRRRDGRPDSPLRAPRRRSPARARGPQRRRPPGDRDRAAALVAEQPPAPRLVRIAGGRSATSAAARSRSPGGRRLCRSTRSSRRSTSRRAKRRIRPTVSTPSRTACSIVRPGGGARARGSWAISCVCPSN